MSATSDMPRWMQDFIRLAQFKSQIFLHGNVKDCAYYPRDEQGQYWELQLVRNAVMALLMHHIGGYAVIGSYDPVDGMIFADDSSAGNGMAKAYSEMAQNAGKPGATGAPHGQQNADGPLDSACRQIRSCLVDRTKPSAFLLEYVPQSTAGPVSLEPNDRVAYLRLLKTAAESQPAPAAGDGVTGCRQNLLVMICDKLTDLPPWLYLDNPFAASISIATPRGDDRRLFFKRELVPSLARTTASSVLDIDELVDLTDGMAVRDLANIQMLAREAFMKQGADEQCDPEVPKPPADAPRNAKALVDRYKYGDRESEWDNLPWPRLDDAESALGQRVMGQPAAVAAVADVLRRARLHLSGVQHSSKTKPRGVLFFAGPTGVGKTEMAKAIAELVFSSEEALQRFDMSEYSASHADQRLLGAPPGYIGYEEGGQLTNAVRESPFCVLLFDEIEKADPSILDKFLQILEDGRMTDGRGETVHFSETVIIFTSNAGIYKLDPRTRWPEVDELGKPILLVDPALDKEYPAVHDKVLDGVQAFFKTVLGRPELLNRIGQNVVVFDFVREGVMSTILHEKVLPSIHQNVLERWKVDVEFTEDAEKAILALCAVDVSSGGRGVGNVAEVAVVNPLARRLYDLMSRAAGADGRGPAFPLEGMRITVTGVHAPDKSDDQRYRLDLDISGGPAVA